jgi:Domain of unknown function (DUF4372)
MYLGKYVFAQVMDHLPLHTFHRCVARYSGEHKVKRFSCLDQYLCMAFAQLTSSCVLNSATVRRDYRVRRRASNDERPRLRPPFSEFVERTMNYGASFSAFPQAVLVILQRAWLPSPPLPSVPSPSTPIPYCAVTARPCGGLQQTPPRSPAPPSTPPPTRSRQPSTSSPRIRRSSKLPQRLLSYPRTRCATLNIIARMIRVPKNKPSSVFPGRSAFASRFQVSFGSFFCVCSPTFSK